MLYECINCHGLNGFHSGMDQCPPTPKYVKERLEQYCYSCKVSNHINCMTPVFDPSYTECCCSNLKRLVNYLF
jgi:hypothetical protein